MIFKNFNKTETSGMFLGVDLSNVYLLDKTRPNSAKKSEKNSKGRKIYQYENHLEKSLCSAERGSCRETEFSST